LTTIRSLAIWDASTSKTFPVPNPLRKPNYPCIRQMLPVCEGGKMGNFVAAAAAARRVHDFASRLGLCTLLAAVTAFLSAPLLAADPASRGASTARATRDEAIRTLPLAKLSPEARNKVAAVISDASLFRRLPIETVDCEPDLFQFVVANP